MDFTYLEKNIVAVIKEQQVKLGYRQEKIRLYYMLSTLKGLLKSESSSEDMHKVLLQFADYSMDRLGIDGIEYKGERFCFCFSEKASIYVNENTPGEGFIYDFIAKISDHHASIEDIKAIFYKYSDNVKIEELDNEDFDVLIYFEKGDIDAFYYCFKDEGGHIIYHRFIKEDYDNFFLQ